jgi:prevent-host-death family protein
MTVHEMSSRQFRENLEREVDKVVAEHEILRVRREGGDFVVVSADDWRAIEETLSLNKIPGLVESLYEAAREPIEEGTRIEDLDW